MVDHSVEGALTLRREWARLKGVLSSIDPLGPAATIGQQLALAQWMCARLERASRLAALKWVYEVKLAKVKADYPDALVWDRIEWEITCLKNDLTR